jgi:uncharacterized membrane protein
MATGTKRRKQDAGRRGDAAEGAAEQSLQPGGPHGAAGEREELDAGNGSESGLRDPHGRKPGTAKVLSGDQLARGLGWFSVGLGLAEVLAPRGIARVCGVRGTNSPLIRLLGLREIAHGVAILSQGGRSAGAVWSRVVGDAVDLACLGAAMLSPRTDKARVAFATANVLGVTALDVLCARQLAAGDAGEEGRSGSLVSKSMVINSTPEELYRLWRDFENLPRFMRHLERVRVTGEGRSHWVARAPAGTTVEWDAEVTEDRPNELIAWRSLEGADVDNRGSVRFDPAPGNRGTIVRVEMSYDPPAGALGALVAKLFGEEPGAQAREALRCLKQVVETGEVVLSDGAYWDNGYLTQRPAQPVSDADFGSRDADREDRPASVQRSAGQGVEG